ncbi:hypothetical protein [Alienimonas chondri]|uniref:hypothetical protein n=1 Tax=Alienimonas chondri TaxID=2681879 RepID=UPI0019D53B13|nr:hypothetical protein [Alienimonas chondri]
MQRVAGQTLFFKNGRWEDSVLTEAQKEKPTEVEQFTDAWFKLAEEAGDKFAPLLSQSEPALVRIKGTTYLIVPPADEETAEEKG